MSLRGNAPQIHLCKLGVAYIASYVINKWQSYMKLSIPYIGSYVAMCLPNMLV